MYPSAGWRGGGWGGWRGGYVTPLRNPFQWIGACLPSFFRDDRAELHQEISQIMYYNICLPICLLWLIYDANHLQVFRLGLLAIANMLNEFSSLANACKKIFARLIGDNVANITWGVNQRERRFV